MGDKTWFGVNLDDEDEITALDELAITNKVVILDPDYEIKVEVDE